MATSAALAANALVIGGGAGAAPATTTTGTGILTFLGTPSSANLLAALTDKTGTGTAVFANAPTLVTPVLGAATGTSLTLGTISSVTGQLKFANSASTNLTTIQAGNAVAARTYTWPTDFGAAGTVLTDAAGNGTLVWAAGGGGGLTVGTTAVTSGTGTRLMYETSGNVLGEISGFTSDGINLTGTGNLTLSGPQSAAAWTTTGLRLVQAAATYTDTSSSGTVAATYINRFGIPTIAASSATTFTNAYNTWFEPPAAGTNVTLTKSWAAGFNGGVVTGAFSDGLHLTPGADSLFEFYGSGSRKSYIQAGNGGIIMVTETGAADIQLRATSQGIVLGNGTNSVRFSFPATATVQVAGGIVMGTAAIATNATDGFLWVISGAGTPTGVPTTYTGRVPMYVDTTNSQLWLYLGGAWKQPKTPAGAALVTWQ